MLNVSMKQRWLTALLFSAAILLPAQEFKVGSRVSDFPLKQLDGSPAQFAALKGNVTVVMFVAVQCPVSNAYNERMNALYRDYASKGVHFVAINSNRSEPASAVQAHAREHNLGFSIYKDDNNVVADRFGATVTPETYVIDTGGAIRYHGSIDDSQEPARIKTQRLRLALDAVLAGKEPPQVETKAFGCSIKRVQSSL
jgi:peroxiredoxin